MAGIPLHITPLSYIRGSGSQYITTAINLRSTDVVRSKWRFENSAGNVYGCFTSSNGTDNFCLYAGSSSTDAYIRYNGQLVRDFRPANGSIHELEQGPGGFFDNGTKLTDFTPATFTCSAPMYIFMLPNSSSAKITGRCYGLTVYRGGDQLCNFIPARNELTGEVGFYESVGGVFYENAGTGAFTAGPEVNFSVKTLLLKRRRALLGAAKGTMITGYTIWGNPTISDGMMTIPNAQSGIIIPEEFNPANNPWEIRTKILYKFTRYSNIFRSCLQSGLESFGVCLQMDVTNTFRFLYSINGTSWVSNTGITEVYPLDNWVWVKVGWDGGNYYHHFSTDGINWTTKFLSNVNPIYQGRYILFGENSGVRFTQSTWDLHNTEIVIAGKIWWKAI